VTEPRADRPDMPAYGIVAADEGEGLLPWSWAEQRLRNARTYWVATVRANGAPHLAPVWALWFDGAVVFSTSDASRKAANFTRDPRCAVSVEQGDDAVIVEGVVAEHDANRREAYSADYARKYDFDMDEIPDRLFAVVPHVVFGFIASDSRFSKTATRWTFTK
jgi:pyridoxamine 5'-phosphate oxidase-like protein